MSTVQNSSFQGPKAPAETLPYDGSGLRIAIVHARWNTQIIEALVNGAIEKLLAQSVDRKNITVQSVPGSYELPMASQQVIRAGEADGTAPPFDVLIAIGVLIKGQSMHFEYISEAVTHGLMRVQLDTGTPIVFGLLTLLNEEQGLDRAGLSDSALSHNLGPDWAAAAVELAWKRKTWAEGKWVE